MPPQEEDVETVIYKVTQLNVFWMLCLFCRSTRNIRLNDSENYGAECA